MAVCFETHGHEDKFWNLGPMPSTHAAALMPQHMEDVVQKKPMDPPDGIR